MTLPSQAKALLALIIGISVIIPAAAMISGNSLFPSINQPATTSTIPPSDLSSPIEQKSEGTGDDASSENQDVRNPTDDSFQKKKDDSSTVETGMFTTEGSRIALVTGYWGVDSAPEPYGKLAGEIRTYPASHDDSPIPWLEVKGSYKENEYQFKIPLESNVFQGFITTTQSIEAINTINGLSWQKNQETNLIIIFFQWTAQQYWIFCQYEKTDGDNPLDTEESTTFVGYWGNDQMPNPNSLLTGEILAKSSSRTNEVITPWLLLDGLYQNNQINIQIPLDQTPFQGFLSTQGTWRNTQDITGSYWHETTTSGLFISFFNWNANQYWIVGTSNDF